MDDLILAIDQGEYNYARAEIAKKTKQFPNKSYYWAANNYLLAATGDHAGALKLNDELKDKVPSDPNTLLLMFDVYRQLGQQNKATEVYENAARKYPSDVVVEAWFKRALETGDIRLLQKAALNMSRLHKDNRLYTQWSAFCYYLLSEQDVTEKERSLYHMLALKLVGEPATRQDLFIQVKIFEKQQAHEKVVAAVEAALPEFIDLELQIIYHASLRALGSWQKLHDECHRLIFEENFNDFDTWKLLIESHHRLGKSKEDLAQKVKLDSRNSYLALIELDTVYSDDASDSMARYYAKFKGKPCCFHDLRVYGNVDMDDDANRAKVAFHAGEPDPTAYLLDNKAHHDAILLEIVKGIEASPSKLLPKILRLEYMVKVDPEYYKARLWLINLYTLANCSELALYHYKQAKIKMIQTDTLSYKVVNGLRPLKETMATLIEQYRFYMTSDYESDKSLVHAFDAGVFNKLEDFLKFLSRLKSSIQRKLLVMEAIRVSRALGNDYQSFFIKQVTQDKFSILNEEWDVSDNRDYQLDFKFAELPVEKQLFPQLRHGAEYVRLQYLKELIAAERDADLAGQLIKLFNKILSNQLIIPQITDFEKWLFKVYLNFFKLTKIESKEHPDLVNFLIKNLKFDKVKPFLEGTCDFDWQFNHVTTALVDFVKIANRINNSSLALYNHQVSQLTNSLLRDLTRYPVTLKSARVFIPKDLDAKLGADFVASTIDEIDHYFKQSIYRGK